MKLAGSRTGSTTRRSRAPLAWAASAVLCLGVGVVASGVGIDLAVVAVASLILLALERTLGDWLADKAGAIPATAGFALVIAGFTWTVIAFSDGFLVAAQKHGYRTVYYRVGRASAATFDDTGASESPTQSSTPTQSTSTGRRTGSISSPTPATEIADAPAKATDVAPSPRDGVGTRVGSKIVFGQAKEAVTPASTTIVLSFSPAEASVARQILFRAVVTAGGQPVTEGAVEFIVNGASLGRVPSASGGSATTGFVAQIAGTYEVRARFLGTRDFAPSSSRPQSLRIQQR